MNGFGFVGELFDRPGLDGERLKVHVPVAMSKREKTKSKRSVAKDHNVYVIALDTRVLGQKKFHKQNPDYPGKRPCLYVGMTSRSPDERFAQHKAGYKAARFAHKYGKWLRRKLYEKYNPLTHAQAERLEKKLAEQLRDKGYAVWQN